MPGHVHDWESLLREFLCSAFDVDGLRRWVRQISKELSVELPEPASLAMLVDVVILGMLRHGLVSGDLFDGLAAARASRCDEVEAIRAVWSGRPRGSRIEEAHNGATASRYEGPRGTKIAALHDFEGRVQPLVDLERLLSKHATVCVVASGIGGVGKTTLVQEFVARRGAVCYPDGSAWLDGQALVRDLARVARRFGWSDTRDPTPAEAVKLLQETLVERRFLLVVDNVGPDDDTSVVPVPGGACRTIVTSRRTTLYLDLDNAAPLELDLWSMEECLAFLGAEGLRRAHDTDKELWELAEFVGRLPLGVRLIAVMLRKRPGTAAAELLKELQRQPIPMLEKYRGNYPGLIATFQASWDALQDSGRRVLYALAACANETRTDIVATLSKVEPAVETLDDLVVRSLVLCSPGSTSPWSLHDIVRMFVAEQPGFTAATARHLSWVAAHLAETDGPLRHAEFAAGVAEATRAFERLLVAGDTEFAVVLYQQLRTHLVQVGKIPAAIALAQALLQMSVDKLQQSADESRIAMMCLTDLGNSCRALGEIDGAIEYHECALKIEVKMGRLVGQATALGNLGICCRLLGDTERAVACHKHALAIEEALGNLAGQANELGSVGLCYLAQNKFDKAVEYLERALVIFIKLGQLAEQANSLGNLGNCYSRLGEIAKAIAYHECALNINKDLGRLYEQANQLVNLGHCQESIGNISKARDLQRRSLALYRRMDLPDTHLSVRLVLDALARLEG